MSVNEHTGEKQQTKLPSSVYDEGWDRIFGNKKLTKDAFTTKEEDLKLCTCDNCDCSN